MAPLVSVVIPTLNYGRYLGRAIESVLAQRYTPLECIVVDNGSTDDTPQVLARYRSDVTALHQAVPGPSAARNAGIRVARGAHIAFLDADDCWKADKLTRQVEFLAADPTRGAVGCGVDFVSPDGAPIGSRDFAVSTEPVGDLANQLRQVAIRRFWIGGSASGAVVRRDVLDDVGLWDEELPSAEDWDLWMRVAAKYTIGNVAERLVAITLHEGGTWRDPARRERNQWRACELATARWPRELASVANRMRALLLADVGGEYAVQGDTESALRKYLASLRHWPYDAARWRAAASLLAKRLFTSSSSRRSS
jgi:hypothetical protein